MSRSDVSVDEFNLHEAIFMVRARAATVTRYQFGKKQPKRESPLKVMMADNNNREKYSLEERNPREMWKVNRKSSDDSRNDLMDPFRAFCMMIDYYSSLELLFFSFFRKEEISSRHQTVRQVLSKLWDEKKILRSETWWCRELIFHLECHPKETSQKGKECRERILK